MKICAGAGEDIFLKVKALIAGFTERLHSKLESAVVKSNSALSAQQVKLGTMNI